MGCTWYTSGGVAGVELVTMGVYPIFLFWCMGVDFCENIYSIRPALPAVKQFISPWNNQRIAFGKASKQGASWQPFIVKMGKVR